MIGGTQDYLSVLMEINTKIATVMEQNRTTGELVGKLVESDGNNRSRIQTLEFKEDGLRQTVSNQQADLAVMKSKVGMLEEDKKFRKRTIAGIIAAAVAITTVIGYLLNLFAPYYFPKPI